MYSVNLPIAFHIRGARSKMHKRRFFTSDMACKTPSIERHTKSRRLPRLQATLRRIESAAPLKTCGGHGSEDELCEHLNVPGSTPQRLQSCHCWRCCQGVVPSNAASNCNINKCHYGGARHARRGCANAAAKTNPKLGTCAAKPSRLRNHASDWPLSTILLMSKPINAANSPARSSRPADMHHRCEVVVNVGAKPSHGIDPKGGFCDVSTNVSVSCSGWL